MVLKQIELKSHQNVSKNHDFCHIAHHRCYMPEEVKKILKYHQSKNI